MHAEDLVTCSEPFPCCFHLSGAIRARCTFFVYDEVHAVLENEELVFLQPTGFILLHLLARELDSRPCSKFCNAWRDLKFHVVETFSPVDSI